MFNTLVETFDFQHIMKHKHVRKYVVSTSRSMLSCLYWKMSQLMKKKMIKKMVVV